MVETSSLYLDGPAGALEALWHPGGPADRATLESVVVVLAHPHPLYGGTMRNAVVEAVAERVVHAGGAALRFNFRGVGASAGHFDDGEGEEGDLAVAVAAARRRLPKAVLWVAGYSFGAAVLLRCHRRLAGLTGALVLAPPITHYAFEAPNAVPLAAIVGDRDELTPMSEVDSKIGHWPTLCALEVLEGAGHDLGAASRPLELAGAIDRTLDRLASLSRISRR